MGSQVLSHSDAGTYEGPIPIDMYAGSVAEKSAQQARPHPDMADRAALARARGLGCVRGITVMIVIEALTTLCLYGIWQLWHIIR